MAMTNSTKRVRPCLKKNPERGEDDDNNNDDNEDGNDEEAEEEEEDPNENKRLPTLQW